MPHCGGAHSCNCVVTGDGVSGSGTLSDPYVITSVPEGGGAVDSVNGEVGAVVLDAADVGAAAAAEQSLPALATATGSLGAATVRPLDVLSDGYLYGAQGTAVLVRSADDGTTWETVQNMGAGDEIIAVRDLANGEVIVSRRTSGLYRSTGWSTSPSDATFAQVVAPTGAGAYFAAFGLSTNPATGRVLVAEYAGSYTDSLRVRLSTDNGVTFSVVYDLTSEAVAPADCHLHLAEIDPWTDDRLWISWHHITNAEPGGVFYSDDDGATWTALTTAHQPTTGTATDRGVVFGSDEAENGVYVVERTTDPTAMVYRRAWSWRENTNGIAGFAYRGFRDPATGLVYVAFVGYPGMPKGIIAASDGVTASQVWRSDALAVDTGDGARNVVVSGERILAPIASNSATAATYETLIAPRPRRGARLPSSDDPGRVLGGRVTRSLSVAAGPGSTAGGLAGSGASAFGYGATATGSQSNAFGWKALASGNNAQSIGDNSQATKAASTAVGSTAKATGDNSTAIGYNTTASGYRSTVLGFNSIASHSNAVALGSLTETTANDQVQIESRHIELSEIASDAASPAANGARLYLKDNGAGKTQLCVRFATGAVVILAEQP